MTSSKRLKISLESLKPTFEDPRLSYGQEGLLFKSGLGERTSHFIKEAETYIKYFLLSQNVQEIILHEMAAGRNVNFVMLKEILSKLYWDGHIANADDFREFIEPTEGVPVLEGAALDPLVEMPLEIDVATVPILLSGAIVELMMKTQFQTFYILFFPQLFMTAKGLLSWMASQFFKKREPLSLQLSLFGIYFKLATGKRTRIGSVQFLAHMVILFGVAADTYFALLHFAAAFAMTITLMMLAVSLSPVHNTDLSNLKRGPLFFITAAIYNFVAVGFCLFCAFKTLGFLKAKDWDFFLYQIIFDVAAVAVFFDFVDQLDQIFSKKASKPRNWAAKFKSSFQKFKTTKDMTSLIRAIPIFDGMPDEVIEQMTAKAKMISLPAGSCVCRDGDLSTQLFVVVQGQVGIFKDKQKIVDIFDGSIFGEGSFLLGHPRKGSAFCIQKTLLLVISRPKAFAATDRTSEDNLSSFQKKVWAFQALSQSPFFKDLPSEAVMQLITRGQLIEQAPHTYIFRQGERSDSLMAIVQGKCEVSVDANVVREMGARDVFGEIGLMWNSPRTSSVKTLEATLLLRVSSEEFWKLLSHHLNIAISLQLLGENRLQTGGFAQKVDSPANFK